MREMVVEPLRVCLACGQKAFVEEDLALFKTNKKGKYGKENLCKNCAIKQARKNYENNHKKIKERSRKYYEEHREERNEYSRKYLEAHPEKAKEYVKKWRKNNPEKLREFSKKYYEENREKRREYSRKHYKEHREEIKDAVRKRYKANPEKVNARMKRYRNTHPFKSSLWGIKTRSKKSGLEFDLDEDYLKQLWVECDGICPVMGVPMLKFSERNDPYTMSIDRIIPEKGYVKGNVRFVSLWYNRAKSNSSDEFTLEMCQRRVKCACVE